MKNEKIYLELMDGEGGTDAKLLIREMVDIFVKTARQHHHTLELIEEREGYVALWLTGTDVWAFYHQEAGEHVWHRVSPTEKRGRVHTSTVKVLVTDVTQEDVITINRKDVDRTFTTGMGPGGQHRNTTNSCVVLKHKPTGLQCRIDGRVQFQNEKLAWKILEQRVLSYYQGVQKQSTNLAKREQFDTLRIRTYKVKDDLVVDHRENKRCSLKQLYKGHLELLHG